MKIERGNLLSRATGSEDELAWLDNYLTFEDDSARFRLGVARPLRLLNTRNGTFPSGFIPLVKRDAPLDGHTVEVTDIRLPPTAGWDWTVDLSWLRDYQLEGVRRVEKMTRGILWIPTAGGKTEIAAGCVAACPIHWLFLVPKAGLLDQTIKRFALRLGWSPDGPELGRVGDGEFRPGTRATVATFQTLHTRLGSKEVQTLLGAAEGVFIDEGHTLPANSYWKVLMHVRRAYYRLVLSGTPLARGDRKSTMVIGGSGPVIYRLRPEVLIDAGVVAKPRIIFHAVLQEEAGVTWQGVYGALVVRSTIRNAAVVRAVREAPSPTLIFVKEITHGRRLRDQLNKAGVGRVDFVHGTHSLKEREQALEKLARGDLDRLVCSDIFDAGIDVPGNVRSGVNAAGGKSVIKALQRLGRGMRVSDDKAEIEWHDFHDIGHGWLEKHSKARAAAYRAEGYEVTVEPVPDDVKTPSLFPERRRRTA